MSKAITIYDIAKCLGISPATVSRALNDHPAVNEKTREVILATAFSLGYKSNLVTNNLIAYQKTSTIGLILPELNSYIRNSIVAGIETITAEAGYKLLLSQTQDSLEKEILNAKVMFDSRVDGLLVSLSYETKDIEHFLPFLENDIPVIFFEGVMEHKKCLCIVIDNLQAAYKATTHLLEQGCRNIIHITGNLNRNVYSDRLKGYKYAHIDHDIPFNENNIIVNNLSQQAGTEAAEQILKLEQLPDGIFVSNDTCAASCMARLKKAGIKIPDDIAIVGFDNEPISEVTEPNLTTIDYSGKEMGEVAAKNLLVLINNLNGWLNTFITDTIVLKTELMIRDSSLKR
ncbi:LacI family DNA-binding transcriptional regulator [Botryobacter ruber]|uniref:LacI family DNA-binding transcriptional regulator n=1 Tax=Botryobacter ruber TaxID=2171629 RepID=UPI000E0AB9FD|nr:LacI family DNA-binding transcriptional regulator [Botryobacter ruber]